MAIKQKGSKWFLQIDRTGIPRIRKQFDTKEEAQTFEHQYLIDHQVKTLNSKDQRTLKDIIELWYKYHGINLADGERRKRCLVALAMALKNPIASQLTAEQFVEYRFEKLQEGIDQKTVNNWHGYLGAVYNKLRKLKVIDYENPVAAVDFIKIQERQLSYLSTSQIRQLMDEIKLGCQNESTWFVAQICLRTGARWGEVENLKFKQLHSGRITFEFTKSKRTRTIPVDEKFYQELIKFAEYKNPNDRIFTNCIGAFRRSVRRADIQLPKGQNSHILRHSFASHFIMNGGNILTLQKILGHADIQMTMRYAHLSADHLADAVRFNPIALKA